MSSRFGFDLVVCCVLMGFEHVDFSVVFKGFWRPRRVLEASREGLGGVLGASWSVLEASWGRLGGVSTWTST